MAANSALYSIYYADCRENLLLLRPRCKHMFLQMHSMNDPDQSYAAWAFVPNSIAGRPFPLQHPLIQSNHPKLLSIWFQPRFDLSEGSMGAALQS